MRMHYVPLQTLHAEQLKPLSDEAAAAVEEIGAQVEERCIKSGEGKTAAQQRQIWIWCDNGCREVVKALRRYGVIDRTPSLHTLSELVGLNSLNAIVLYEEEG